MAAPTAAGDAYLPTSHAVQAANPVVWSLYAPAAQAAHTLPTGNRPAAAQVVHTADVDAPAAAEDAYVPHGQAVHAPTAPPTAL